MGLTPKPDPLRELLALQQQLNKLLEERLDVSVGSAEFARGTGWSPAVDVFETAATFEIVADLPGFAPGDVTVSVDGHVLTLRGERKNARGNGVSGRQGTKQVHRMEREHGSFSRTFTLPESVDTLSLVSRYEDGVLHLTLSKAKRKSSSKKK